MKGSLSRRTRLLGLLLALCATILGSQAPLSAMAHRAGTASPGIAGFPFPLIESFKNSAPDNANWVLGGPAALTGGSVDPSGDGWLRLTSNAPGQLGYAYYNVAFPLNPGIVVSFDYAAWGGNGFDGSSFFLFDGATTTFVPGGVGYGGPLGYEPGSNCASPGLSNGYVGIGLDEGGDFSPPNCNNGGPGTVPNAVTLRGSGKGTTGYLWLTSSGTLPTSLDVPNVSRRPSQTGPGYRHVTITITANQLITVQMQFGAAGAPQTVISQYNLATAPGQEKLPATLKFGFAGATGDFTNNHEVRNVSVVSAGPTLAIGPAFGALSRTVTVTGTAFAANEPVALYWDSLSSSPIATPTTAADGSFSISITAPASGPGPHPLVAVGQSSGLSASASFDAVPVIGLTPATGAAGTTVTASGRGFDPQEAVNLYWAGPPKSLLGSTTTTVQGSFGGSSAITFTVPSSAPGSYAVCALGQTSNALACKSFTITS